MELSAVKHHPLSQQESSDLHRMLKSNEPYHIRRRAHAVLLIFEDRKSYQEVGQILRVHPNSVRNWSERWIAEHVEGLYDLEGRGAKPRFTPEEQTIILACVEEEPRSLRKVAEIVEQKTGKKAGVETFRRLLKKKARFGNDREK